MTKALKHFYILDPTCRKICCGSFGTSKKPKPIYKQTAKSILEFDTTFHTAKMPQNKKIKTNFNFFQNIPSNPSTKKNSLAEPQNKTFPKRFFNCLKQRQNHRNTHRPPLFAHKNSVNNNQFKPLAKCEILTYFFSLFQHCFLRI